jgi:hypothetical protein
VRTTVTPKKQQKNTNVPTKYYNTGTYRGIHKSAFKKWNWKKYEGANI